MPLRFKLQLVVISDDDKEVCVDRVVVLDKQHDRVEHLGLSLIRKVWRRTDVAFSLASIGKKSRKAFTVRP
jgi:hypothetical protein